MKKFIRLFKLSLRFKAKKAYVIMVDDYKFTIAQGCILCSSRKPLNTAHAFLSVSTNGGMHMYVQYKNALALYLMSKDFGEIFDKFVKKAESTVIKE